MSKEPTQVFRPKMLKHYLDQFQVFEISDTDMEPFRVLPLGVLQIFFQLDHAVYHNTSFTKKWEKRPDAFIAGPYNLGYSMAVENGAKMFSLKFWPGRYRHFFLNSIEHFKNSLVPLSEFWGQSGKILEDKIFNAKSHKERCNILERFLFRHLTNATRSPIENAVQTIIQCRGIGRINNFAAASNLSPSQFRRRFIAEIGLSPKEFQRVTRIGALKDYFHHHPGISLTQLAYQFGYYDQSHFIKDFSSITGQTPKSYFS